MEDYCLHCLSWIIHNIPTAGYTHVQYNNYTASFFYACTHLLLEVDTPVTSVQVSATLSEGGTKSEENKTSNGLHPDVAAELDRCLASLALPAKV